MGITLAVTILAYLMLIVLAYETVIYLNLEEKKSEEIITKAFTYALSILAFGLLIVYILLILPPIYIDHQTTSYLILASKFVSVFTLGGSLYVLKRCNQ
jgi:hypothetical protein